MNKFETLVACRNHWSWLWITGRGDKSSYSPSRAWSFWCACCEYCDFNDFVYDSAKCNMCPLNGYAWELKAKRTRTPCEGQHSFYKKWINSKTEKYEIKMASRMVYACNRAIEDMIINGEI